MRYQNSEHLAQIFKDQGSSRYRMAQTSAKERIQKLKKLRAAIVKRQDEFYSAIAKDFHKSKFEAWLCEVFPAIEELDTAIENLSHWMKDKSGSFVFFLPTTKSVLHYEPKGRVLILSPWNYPFLLFITPLVSAIAAGNTAILKPSNKTPNVSAFLASLIEELFPPNEIAVIEGEGAAIGDELLKLPFDHIFFTGSPHIGAHVAEMAAKNYASITLELGGKSPAFILPHVNLRDAAKKLAWGKSLNAGQTCVAPDYVLCPQELSEKLAHLIADELKKMYGETPDERRNSPDYVHIIDTRSCARLQNLVEDAVSQGAHSHLDGSFDIEARYAPLTILSQVKPSMRIMETEIFGPILPIISYENLEDAISFVQNRPKPLALYIFANDRNETQRIINQTSSGSTCVNNCIVQIENLSMPFGGVGMSGTGNYHGFYGFKTFSHERNIMHQHACDVLPFFYAPFHRNAPKNLREKIQKISEKFLCLFKRM